MTETAERKASEENEGKGKFSQAESNILKIAEIEREQKADRTIGERVAEYVAAFCGSMIFVYVHIVWFGTWIIINSLTNFTFDPFPYTFLTLVVSLEAIFLSTFILISQNQETQLTERRNHLDLQINMLAEEESTKTLELLQKIAHKVGVDLDEQGTEELLKPTDPGKLVKKIMDSADESGNESSGDQEPESIH